MRVTFDTLNAATARALVTVCDGALCWDVHLEREILTDDWIAVSAEEVKAHAIQASGAPRPVLRFAEAHARNHDSERRDALNADYSAGGTIHGRRPFSRRTKKLVRLAIEGGISNKSHIVY